MLKAGWALLSVLCWTAVEYSHAGSEPTTQLQCTYVGSCSRTLQPPRICGPFPWCQSYQVNLPCLVSEDCTTTWSPWRFCTRRCGGGTRTRRGNCISSNCRRFLLDNEFCNTQDCDARVDGGWDEWSPWASTSCSETCCGGTYSMTRTRNCTNPAPQGLGRQCRGEDTDVRTAMPCGMTENCPLSCVNATVPTFFSDPCGGPCSNRFFTCSGEDMPDEAVCPQDHFWDSSNVTCQPMEMCTY